MYVTRHTLDTNKTRKTCIYAGFQKFTVNLFLNNSYILKPLLLTGKRAGTPVKWAFPGLQLVASNGPKSLINVV